VVGAFTVGSSSPANAATPPKSNKSFYVHNNASKLNSLGCQQGQRDVALGGVGSMVILDFGGQTGTGATKLIGGETIPYSQMQTLTAYFAAGYYGCSSGSAHTTLVLGTNNSLNVTTGMGSGWANAVIGAKNLVNSNGHGSRVSVRAGNDLEQDYSSRTAARAWMSGYSGFSGRPNVMNFGAASGCPTSGTAGCNNSWTQNDVFYLSYGASPALPLPEIYNNTMALQWDNIITTQGYMGITGTLSQAYSCSQLGDPCTGTNMTPDSAWLAVNAATGQSPAYSCNIGWSQLA
jgi:hypothetical protein